GISIENKRRPYVHGLAVRDRVVDIPGMVGSRRHHADHFERQRVQYDFAPDDAGIGAELAFPDAIAEDCNAPAVWNLVVLTELASALRLETKHVKEPGFYTKADEPQRFTRARKLKVGVRVGCDAFEALSSRPEIAQIEMIDGKLRELRVVVKD